MTDYYYFLVDTRTHGKMHVLIREKSEVKAKGRLKELLIDREIGYRDIDVV